MRSVEPRAVGLANAVLRKIAGAKEDFPFGNPEKSLQALARQHAFPPLWLAKTVLDDRGLPALKDFMAASNEVAPLYLAVNALRSSEDEARSAFTEASAGAEPCGFWRSRYPALLALGEPPRHCASGGGKRS